MTDISSLPALATGAVTFGCLNNFRKVTAPTLETWARLLTKLPTSRLIIHARQGSHRDRVFDTFNTAGVNPNRIEFAGLMTLNEYFDQYHRIDIALDPFPYAGGTTTCDTLWMGVPVVTLAGQTAVGRGGVSILSNMGLSQNIAQTTDQYAEIAADLAGDLSRLAELRSGLRQRMRHSALMDAPAFARDMEAAYRRMWREWCDSFGKGS